MLANKYPLLKKVIITIPVFLVVGAIFLSLSRDEEADDGSIETVAGKFPRQENGDLSEILGVQDDGDEGGEGEYIEKPKVAQGYTYDDEVIGPSRSVGDTAEEIPDQPFGVASFYQTSYMETPVGSIRSLSIDVGREAVVYRVDFSEYEDGVLAFNWESGSFELGLTDQRQVPKLEQVEASDEINEYSNTKVSELIPFRESKILFIRTLDHVVDLSVDIITPSKGSVGWFSIQANHNSGAKYSSLNIIPREEWSGDLDINNPSRLIWDPYYYTVEKVVIHHTVTPNGEDPIYWMKAIYSYHTYRVPWCARYENGVCVDQRYGWGDIGYNYLIDQYGNIYEGKLGGDEAKGYHAGAANANSIGISLIGTFTDTAPSAAAQNAFMRLIAEKGAFYNFNPEWHVTVFGHRDYMATACPGNAFYARLPGLTASAQAYDFSTIKSVVSEVDNNVDNGDYKPDKFGLIFEGDVTVDMLRDLIPMYFEEEEWKMVRWTGIEKYDVKDNIVILTVDYFGFSTTETTKDRLRTLYKVFRLDNRVKYAGLIQRGQVLEIPE